MPQVVQHLPGKYESLSSNSSTAKKIQFFINERAKIYEIIHLLTKNLSFD
jgi:hypothetical protein